MGNERMNTMENISGTVWKFGDNVDTGQLAPTQFSAQGVEVYSKHCLENFRPDFAERVAPGDIVVAGKNFGTGSSRETAVLALRHLQVGAVIADFFARIFFRNAVNLGLPVIECKNVAEMEDGDYVTVFPTEGKIVNHTRDREHQGLILPEHVMKIIRAGGLVPYLEKTLSG